MANTTTHDGAIDVTSVRDDNKQNKMSAAARSDTEHSVKRQGSSDGFLDPCAPMIHLAARHNAMNILLLSLQPIDTNNRAIENRGVACAVTANRPRARSNDFAICCFSASPAIVGERIGEQTPLQTRRSCNNRISNSKMRRRSYHDTFH